MSQISIGSYIFREPDGISYEWSYYNRPIFNLRISNTCSIEYIFLRLLSGGIVIDDGRNIFLSKENYFSNPISLTGAGSLLSNFKFIFGSEKLRAEDIINALLENRSNSVFYKNLCIELAQLLTSMRSGSFTKAFLHLYRSFESISFTFPLYYVKREGTYSGAYSRLKSYFDNGGQSELHFCKSFINKYVDSTILDAMQVIKFDSNKTANIKTLKKLTFASDIDFSSSDPMIATKYVWDLIVESRNRYFHNLSGMGNSFTSSHLPDPDSYFKELIPIGLHLLSNIYLSIISYRL